MKNFVDALLREEYGNVLSIVLFGSMAKGTYNRFSDFDLIVVVREEELPFKDRPLKYLKYSDGWVEAFVYTREEVEYMFKELNPFILEALKDGIMIYDDGFWSKLRSKFEELMEKGIIRPKKNGWIISRQAGS
mgnify:CR=1 FL=1